MAMGLVIFSALRTMESSNLPEDCIQPLQGPQIWRKYSLPLWVSINYHHQILSIIEIRYFVLLLSVEGY